MARFCKKCGCVMRSNTCPACGAPAAIGDVIPLASEFAAAAVPVAAPPPVQPAPFTPPPAPYPAAQPAPPTKSGGALKIILIILAVIVGIGIITAGVVGYGAYTLAHAVHTDGEGKISVLGSSFSTGKDVKVPAQDLGVPSYPGATKGEGGTHLSLPTANVLSAVYLTNDAPSQVEAFYKGKIGENESVTDTSAGVVMSATNSSNGKKSSIAITIAQNSGKPNKATRITIMHTTSTR